MSDASLSYVFLGTADFCLPALDVLVKAGREPAAVVCQPDRAQGRGRKIQTSLPKTWAANRGIAVLQPGQCREEGFLGCWRETDPDLGLVFAFGQLLPPDLLSIPRLGFINIHPSLLPRYRGAAPLQWALINGERQTGVSIVKVTPRLDDGEILRQVAVDIDPEENAIELGQRLAVLGGELCLEVLDQLEQGRCQPRAQDESGVLWARALRKEDGLIDWTQSAQQIHNLVRGVQPWPGAVTHLGQKSLKIHRATRMGISPKEETRFAPGQIIRAQGDQLLVACQDGPLRLLEVQLEGKRRLDTRAFLSGRSLRVGETLT